jgi:peptidoglycan L-alanyl-D-glutamate endopeptidase CwlK
MTIRKAAVVSGTPSQLKQLVAEADKRPNVTNQDVINYLAKGTTIPNAWVKARSFGIDPDKLVRSGGENVRRREFMPQPPVIPAPAAKPKPAPASKPAPDESVGGTPADVQANVAVALHKKTNDVTNQDVLTYFLKGKSYEDGAPAAANYGVRLDDLCKDPATRKAPFDGSPLRSSTSPAEAKADAALLKELNANIANLTQQLPASLRNKISANVADIKKNAQNVYDTSIANGKTEAVATAARRSYVEGELNKRGPKLDADIQELLAQKKLDPKFGPMWDQLKGQLKDPGLYTKAVAADERYEEISHSIDLVDKTYKTKDPDKVEETPPTPLTPGVSVSNQPLTAVEKNYLATLKDDPLFAKRILGTAGFYKGPLSPQWDSKVEQAAMEAVNSYRETRQKYGPLDSRSEAAIITLHPNAQAAARQVINQMNAEFAKEGNGLTAKVLWGTRTYAQQNALFNQRPKVTNARGGQSNHNFGIAFDIGLFKGGQYLENDGPYRAAHNVVNVPGLSWGGNWKSIQDTPHYQLTIRGKEPNIGEMRGLLESGQALPVTPLQSAA